MIRCDARRLAGCIDGLATGECAQKKGRDCLQQMTRHDTVTVTVTVTVTPSVCK